MQENNLGIFPSFTRRFSKPHLPSEHLIGHGRLPYFLVFLLDHRVYPSQELPHAGRKHLQVVVEAVVSVVQVVVRFSRDLRTHLLPRLQDIAKAWDETQKHLYFSFISLFLLIQCGLF